MTNSVRLIPSVRTTCL